MQAIEILSSEDLLQPRTVLELLTWINQIDASLSETKASRAQARSGGGPYKKFREEIRPFSHCIRYADDSGAIVRFPPENHSADIIVESGEKSESFQITLASDPKYGEEEALRMLALSDLGHVPGFWRVRVEGGRASGRFQVEGRAVGRARHAEEVAERTLRAIERKASRQSDDGMVLIVVVYSPIAAAAMPMIFDLVEQRQISTPFRQVILVDDSDRTPPRVIQSR